MVFLFALFFLKTKIIFKNEENSGGLAMGNGGGLAYNKEIISDLVNKDTDGDGVLDWEEGLWGTDPHKRDTDNNGVSDSAEIAKIKAETGGDESLKLSPKENESLTETDKFSRELFSTIATLNQSGAMDQATVDKLSSSITEQIKSSTPRKIFTISDIKIINSDTTQDIKNYLNTLNGIRAKYPLRENVTAILAESMKGGGDIDVEVLNGFDPITKQMGGVIKEMAVANTPQSLSFLSVAVMNGFERVIENLNDMKLIDADTILALGAISQYEENAVELQKSINKLLYTINQKLSN